VASLSDAILPPPMRKKVVQLYPLENWRLLYYRRDRSGDPRADIVEDFLVSSVLDDPDFPAISRGDRKLGQSARAEAEA